MSAERSTTCDDIQPWLAAHALGEADDDPTAQEHLAACPRCQHDLHEYRRVAGLLPYAAPDIAPAPALREQVIAAVAREAGIARPEKAAAPRASALRKSRPVARRWPIFSRATWAAFAFAVLAVALFGWNIALQSQINEQTAQIAFHRQTWQTMIGLLNDSSLQWYPIAGDRANGRFWTTPQSQVACLVAQGLPQLAQGQVLQVWLVRDGTTISGGTFAPRDGNGWILVAADGPVARYESLFVTIEPRGGSAAPSGQQVMRASLVIAATPGLSDRQELLRLLRGIAQGDA